MHFALWFAQGATSSTFSPSLSLTLNEGKKFAETQEMKPEYFINAPVALAL